MARGKWRLKKCSSEVIDKFWTVPCAAALEANATLRVISNIIKNAAKPGQQ
jgi:hypothetical protein